MEKKKVAQLIKRAKAQDRLVNLSKIQIGADKRGNKTCKAGR